MMACTERSLKYPPPLRCHPRGSEALQTAEEYVLDEHDFKRVQSSNMPQDKRGRGVKQQRHVRRSAELRTVSIIETLSELVAQTDACHLGGPHDDCDAQCQNLCSGSGKCHAWPSCCKCCAEGVQQGSAAEVNQSARRCFKTNCPSCKRSNANGAPDGGSGCLFKGGDPLSPKIHEQAGTVEKGNPQQQDRVVARGTNQHGATCHLTAATGQQHRVQSKEEPRDDASSRCIHCLAQCCFVEGRECRLQPSTPAASSSVTKCCPHNDRSTTAHKVSSNVSRVGLSDSNDPSIKTSFPSCSSSSATGPFAYRKTPISPKRCHKKGKTLSSLKKKSTLHFTSQTTSISSCRNADRTTTPKSCPHVIRDPTDFMLSTLRSKGRTPDWIAGIFSISRRGNLDMLNQALLDMDATLIRNLSDHRGNNLFHVCCCYGHLDCLQWLLQRGKQCEDAILDENKYELTPLVCAVKYGKLPCVEWLIRNTIAHGQLVPGTCSRPLLHWAAKYGQEVILRWLAEYMENNGMDVNVKDGYGNTALHLAAKHGHAVSIKALVTHHCDVSLKNDLGYKASDYAILYGQTACSEYLLSLEACLLLSSDVSSLDADLSSSKAEMSEMKTQFKDVLSCAKKLCKEREELSQHLDRLQDGLVHLNDIVISEIQSLCEENNSLRKQLSDSGKIEDSRRSLDETIALCHAMHTRWQDGQQRWLSPTALADIQQKILLAEERWKRARARVTWGDKESKEHMNVFRERLTQVQCRATGIRLSDIRSISSSESSLASMEDTLSDYEERYELVIPPKLATLSPTVHRCNCQEVGAIEKQRFQPPVPPSLRDSSHAASTRLLQCTKSGPSSTELRPANPSKKSYNAKSSLFPKSVKQVSSLMQEYRLDKIPSVEYPSGLQKRDVGHSVGLNGRPLGMGLVSQGTCKVLEVIVSSNGENEHVTGGDKHGIVKGVGDFIHELERSWGTDPHFEGNPGMQNLSKTSKVSDSGLSSALHLKKIKQDRLTGSCKLDGNVLQSGKDGDKDDDDDDNHQPGKGCQRRQGGENECNSKKENLENSGGGGTSERRINFEERQDERSGTQANDCHDGDNDDDDQRELLEVKIPSSLPSSAPKSYQHHNNGKLISPEPDLIIGTKGIRNEYENPASVCAGDGGTLTINSGREPLATNVDGHMPIEPFPEDCDHLTAEEDLMDVPLHDDDIKPLLHTSGDVSFMTDDVCMGISVNVGSGGKRRGFLQKLNLRWPSKRKVKNPKRVQEITPEDFRETYMHSRNVNGIEETFVEIQGISSNEIVADGNMAPAPIVSLVNVGKFDISETSDSENCSRQSISIKQHSENVVAINADESRGLMVKQTNDMSFSSPSSCSSTRVMELNGVFESTVSRTKARNVPIPPLPIDIRNPPQPLSLSNGLPLSCSSDHQSVGQGSNFIESLNTSMPQQTSCNEERHSCLLRSASLERVDDELFAEEHKKSSRPEADQNMGIMIGMELGMSEEDDSTLIHAQAAMPPLRPMSCGAKSDQSFVFRPASSASRAESYSAYRLPGFPLRKVSSLSTDLLTPGSLTPSRMSPAPSEVSKTESALSPPSDISKTESMRNMRQLTRIEEKGTRPIPALPMKLFAEIKTAAIIDTNLEVPRQLQEQRGIEDNSVRNTADSLHDRKTQAESSNKGTASNDKNNVLVNSSITNEVRPICKMEKPWYELSDDEEFLMPETLKRTVGLVKNGSEDEDVYYCT